VKDRFKDSVMSTSIRQVKVSRDTARPMMCDKCVTRVSSQSKFWMLNCSHNYHENCHSKDAICTKCQTRSISDTCDHCGAPHDGEEDWWKAPCKFHGFHASCLPEVDGCSTCKYNEKALQYHMPPNPSMRRCKLS
jgi:hypothetical protein